MSSSTLILNHTQIGQKIDRIATEIYENNFEESDIIIAGIANRGYLLAERITTALKQISDQNINLIKIHVDRKFPYDGCWDQELSAGQLDGKVVLLVDDVLNTGTTLIHGAKYILENPIKQLITVVLVNRRHRLYPIRADYVGLTLATTMQEHISVELANGQDAVYLK